MNLAGVLKKIFINSISVGLISRIRLKKITNSNVLTVLNFHRVHKADGSAYRPLCPDLFDHLLQFLTRHFYIITFAELSDLEDKVCKKPLLIITFDDGYKDFFTVAVPLLKKHGVSVNQNIIPECVDSGFPPLNVAVQDFIGKASNKDLGKIQIADFDMGDVSERVNLGARVSKFLKNRPIAEQREISRKIFDQIRIIGGCQFTPMMSLCEIREIINIHEIGVHSYFHSSMAFEALSFVERDFEDCRSWFLENLDVYPKIYAFPNGSYKDEHISMALEFGFEHILLVDDCFSSAEKNVHARFGIEALRLSELKFRALGSFRPIRITS